MPTVTQGWLDEQREAMVSAPRRPGASARIEFRVTGGGDGEVVFHTVVEDGRITQSQLGPDDQCDFSMRMPVAIFAEVVEGSLDADVGFMRGEIKVSGDVGRMLSVLPVTRSPEWRAATPTLPA